ARREAGTRTGGGAVTANDADAKAASDASSIGANSGRATGTAAATPHSTARGERHLASHFFNIGILLVGATALAFMLHRLGFGTVKNVLSGVGWTFALIVGLDVAALACEAAAIRELMRPEARMVKYWRVLAAQASGRAINILTPGGALGEATKVTMLVSFAPRDRVVSSIVLLNLASFYLSVTIVIIGVPITLLLVDLPHALQVIVWIGLAVLVPVVAGIAVLIQRGAVATALAAAHGVHLISRERADRWTAKLADIDRHVRELQSDQTPGTRAGLAFIGGARVCAWSATTLVLYSVGAQIGFTLLIGAFSVGVLIGWISALIPFGLGVADTGNYALFNVLGASGAHGVFVTLLGRARSLTLALLGLLVMAAGHTANRLEIARRNRLIARLEAEHGAESPARSG
ncbi:MAG TPA: lysylphosphatidylglycerol synthase transmembrane domain-containing protein, partial [Kofleriaceae bacterium]|nr:lysylphosphatidylglycerol synthase transmembrane domain-containing protein [Kofleriaceae bacterium]